MREAMDRGVALLTEWLVTKKPIYQTHINGNANLMAKTLPLFKKFVAAHPDFWREQFGYIPQGKAGQKSKHYITFTDFMLRRGLEEITGETVKFEVRSPQRRVSGSTSDPRLARAVANYGAQPESERKAPPNRRDKSR